MEVNSLHNYQVIADKNLSWKGEGVTKITYINVLTAGSLTDSYYYCHIAFLTSQTALRRLLFNL